jgi:hypothetical protein
MSCSQCSQFGESEMATDRAGWTDRAELAARAREHAAIGSKV